MQAKDERLGTEPIVKLLLKLSIPSIVGMVAQSLYSVVDRMFIGKELGHEAIAGLTITYPIMIILWAFSMLVGIGAGAVTSIKLGQEKKDDANIVLGNTLILFITVYVITLTLGLAFDEPILYAFGATENTVEYAMAYTDIIVIGGITLFLSFGLNNIIRAEGNALVAMGTMIVGAIINIVLDYFFIIQFGWGIEGAAYATVISQLVSAIWVFGYFFTSKSVLNFKRENLKPNLRIIKYILFIGLAPFGMQIASAIIALLYNFRLTEYGGDKAIAAYGIVNSVCMTLLMPIFGVNQGAQPIIGYNYGAEQHDRVKKVTIIAAVTASIITTIGFFFVQLMPDTIIAAFNGGDEELQKLGVEAARIIMAALPVVGFQIVCSSYFQAIGKAKTAIFLSVLRQIIVLGPLVWFLPTIFDLDGIWYAGPISDVVAAIVTFIVIFIEFRRLDKNGKQHI